MFVCSFVYFLPVFWCGIIPGSPTTIHYGLVSQPACLSKGLSSSKIFQWWTTDFQGASASPQTVVESFTVKPLHKVFYQVLILRQDDISGSILSQRHGDPHDSWLDDFPTFNTPIRGFLFGGKNPKPCCFAQSPHNENYTWGSKHPLFIGCFP